MIIYKNTKAVQKTKIDINIMKKALENISYSTRNFILVDICKLIFIMNYDTNTNECYDF